MTQRVKRLAVVIGNSEYQNLAELANATTDADAIQKMLQSLEFEVTYGINLSRDRIIKCFSDILDTSWEYEAKEIVFYYSGRAIPSFDKVYLAPYDADINLPETLSKSYLDVDTILKSLLKKRKNYKVPIVFILNCYHFLLKSGSIDGNYRGIPLQKVSQEIGKNSNIAIIHSMTKDELDWNDGNELSSFAKILLENMEKDCTINRMHSALLRFIEDSEKFHDIQVSWLYQSLLEPYKFCHPKTIAIVPHDYSNDPYYGIPSSNQNFVNRPGIFAKIDAIFRNRSSLGGRTILALQGLGGTGKTQIMLQYCYIHRFEYDFIFWLEMDSRIAALESFRKLAINLGLDIESANKKSADNSIIKWVSGWLEKMTRWLLLLNNVDEEMTKDIFNVLPQYRGNIMMTTREPIPLTKAKVIHVTKMEEDEALTLLYGVAVMPSINQQSMQHQYAKEIISELDSLPLAVDLARAYTDTMAMSFKDYLGMFRNQRDRAEIFSHRDEDNVHQYNHSLATVWRISFDRIKNESPMAALILGACSFLKPELIPICFFEKQYRILELLDLVKSNDYQEMFLKFSTMLMEEKNDSWKRVRTAIGILVKFSFVSRTLNEDKDRAENPASETLTIHRLVQKVNYDAMNKEEKARWIYILSTALKNEICSSDSYSSLARATMNAYFLHICHFSKMIDIKQKEILSEDLLALIIRTVRYLLDNGVYFGYEELLGLTMSISESIYEPESEPMARSLDCLASLYQYQGNYTKAKSLYEQALVISEKASGPEHSSTATSLNNLAGLYISQGNYGKAKPLFERALVIKEKALGPEHPETATSLNNLAGLYESQGNYWKTEPLYERALVIKEKALGREHPSTAMSLNNLAGLYYSQGNYVKAEPLYERALIIFEKALGPKHPSTATSLNCLAGLYYRQGNYGRAKPLIERALVIFEKALGPNHPETAISLNNLARLYYHQGNYGKAKPLFERALVIKEKALGPDHPETAMSLNNLARLHDIQGNYVKAEPLYKQALVISEKALGPEHRETATSLNNLAGLYYQQGNYGKAEPLYERALMIFEKALGPDHPFTATSLNNLARLYETRGNYSKAEQLYERVLMIFEKSLGPEHPETATSLGNLAGLYCDQGNYGKAEPLFERALVIKEKALGPEHPETARSLNNFAMIYNCQGNYGRAEPLYERAMVIKEKVLGPEHPGTATSLNNLAGLYENQGNYAKAKLLYERALVISEKALGPEHPKTATSLGNLARLYYRQGNYGKAEPLIERALVIYEKALGPEHPGTATSLNNLAGLYHCQRNYGKAKPLHERALVISEKALGPEHPETAASLNNLAELYYQQGNYDKAEPLYERALVIFEKTLGSEHPDTAVLLNNLALLYFMQGKYEAAEPLLQRALAIVEKALGSQHLDAIHLRESLAVIGSAISMNIRVPQHSTLSNIFTDSTMKANMHPHSTIYLHYIPELYTDPILLVDSSSIEFIFTKLNNFVTQKGISLSYDEKQILVCVRAILDKDLTTGDLLFNGDRWNNFMLKCLNTLPPANQFPVLDIFRLLLTSKNSSVINYYKNNFEVIATIIERVNQITEIPRSLALMTLRMTCNAFAFMSNTLLTNISTRTTITTLLITNLTSSHIPVRRAASSVAFNLMAVIASQRRRCQEELLLSRNEMCQQNQQLHSIKEATEEIEDEDWETEIAVAVMAAIEKENDENTLYRLIGALVHLFYLRPKESQISALIRTLGVEAILEDKMKWVKGEKVKGLCEEIEKIFRIYRDIA